MLTKYQKSYNLIFDAKISTIIQARISIIPLWSFLNNSADKKSKIIPALITITPTSTYTNYTNANQLYQNNLFCCQNINDYTSTNINYTNIYINYSNTIIFVAKISTIIPALISIIPTQINYKKVIIFVAKISTIIQAFISFIPTSTYTNYTNANQLYQQNHF